jgi:hypothetical protein
VGKGARLRQAREQRLPLVFVDLDFDRASQPFGRGARNPPMGWAVGRAGLVFAEWDGTRCRIVGDALIESPHPASRLVAALAARRGLIIRHGLLQSDLQAVAMVTGIPGAVMDRTLDTLQFATRLRTANLEGSRGLSTGCSLTDLMWQNLQVRRAKPAIPPNLAGDPELRVGRGDHDPREDAALVARLWEHRVIAQSMRWGSGMWGAKTGTAELTDDQVAELLGKRTDPGTRGTRQAFTAGGPRANLRIAASLGPPTALRQLAERLQDADLLDPGRLSDEELFTACQWMGWNQNMDVRDRLADGRKLTKVQRVRLAQALWESTHLAEMSDLFRARRDAANGSVIASVRVQHLMNQQAKIRADLGGLFLTASGGSGSLSACV